MSKRILIVDDDSINLKLAEFVIKQKGYETHTAMSGAECISKLEGGQYDLVILDVEMPDMNGVETLEKIRETEALANQKVCFLSAALNQETKEASERLKALDYVQKPIMPQKLWDLLETIFAE